MQVATWIRHVRQAAKLTQAQLGEAVGCTRQNVWGWEHGQHRPDAEQLKAIARATNRPLSEVNELLGLPAEALGASTLSLAATSGVPSPLAHHKSQDERHTAVTLPSRSLVRVIGQAGLETSGFVMLQRLADAGYVPYPTRHATAYAIRQIGDALDPFARHGDYIVIDPDETVQSGDNVLVRLKDGGKLVARLRYIRDGRVYLDPIIPGADTPAPLDEDNVATIDFVVGPASSRYWLASVA